MISLRQEKRNKLVSSIANGQRALRQEAIEQGNLVPPRTQAANVKIFKTLEEEKQFRLEIVEATLATWKQVLPQVIADFAKVPDPRRAKSVKHKIAVVMMFALLLFVFRLKSRKQINQEMSKPQFLENLRSVLPELDSTPHSDTVARVLEKVDPCEISDIHTRLIKKLIQSKKFKKFLIFGGLPISIDGVHKIVRDGELQDENWLERTVGKDDNQRIQQYVYVIEVNITLKNGLSIPLISEFLYYDGNTKPNKQDCELTGFERVAKKLKSLFKRQKFILCMDKLYPNKTVLEIITTNSWNYIIVLPGNKLKEINAELAKKKENKQPIEDQTYYNGRQQDFYFKNNITWNGFNINAVACFERWDEIDQKTAEKTPKFSEHKWITNLRVKKSNLHELCNLCARKRWGIEDSNNTEKNRGYHYTHAFSYNWNGMWCFHLLMRLAHAINALSEYTKTLKNYMRRHGVSWVLDCIKETFWNPWFTEEWINKLSRVKAKLVIESS